MFPIGDDNSERTITPYVTWVLLALNVAVFLYEVSLGAGVDRFLLQWGAVPRRVMAGEGYLTLFSSMFLHGGWMHLIGNMLFLKVFGDNVEDRQGHLRFLLFYLLTGLAAHAAQIMVNPGSRIPSVGASGAISGVLGAYILMFHRNRVNVFFGYGIIAVPAWMMIGFWAAEQFLATYVSIANTTQTGETGGVAYAAHAGGFVAGLIFGPLFAIGRRRRDPLYG